MRRWFGIALLGLLVAVAAFAVLTALARTVGVGSGPASLIGIAALAFIAIGGIAFLVGLVGVAVAAIRGPAQPARQATGRRSFPSSR